MSDADAIPSLKVWRAQQSRLSVLVLAQQADIAHVLKAGGSRRYQLDHALSIDALLDQRRAPDVLVYPMSLGEDRLLTLYQSLHRKGTVFLLAGNVRYASPEITRISAAVIAWPIHLLELNDTLDRLQSRVMLTELKVSQENAQRVALLWSRGETGRLRFQDTGQAAKGELALFEGAVSPADWSRFYPLLHSGTIRFKRSRSISRGHTDRAWTGGVLLNAAHRRGSESFTLRCASGVLAAPSFALDLPLAPQTCRLLQAADGTTDIETLLRNLRINPPTVGEDLHALSWLKLLTWAKRPSRLHTRNGSRSRSQPRSNITTSPGRSLFTATSVSGKRTRTKRLERPDAVRVWLTKLVNELPQATPTSILGVSADVSDEMLQIAEQRLLDRYDGILNAANVPEDIEQMARKLRRISQRAAAHLRKNAQQSATRSPQVADYRSGQRQSPEDELLTRGHRLIEAQDWAQADHLLSDALRIAPKHPGVLSALAWARYNNAGLNKPDRESRARGLLREAIEEDASFAEAHYYLAQIHHAAGNAIAARASARRASRLAPGEARYDRLLRKV